MRTAFITGIAGFIGTHLWKALCEAGYTVSGCDLKTGGDIRTMEFSPADVCFHLAAQSNAHSTDLYEDATHNILGTLRVLEYYREKTVFAASEAIHHPVTSYAITKFADELYCRLYGARVVRMCNITGPGGHGVFEKFAEANILKIAGKGDQMRTYAPVSRAVAAFMAAALKPPGDLTILTGVDLSVMDIADIFYPNKSREFIEQPKTDLADIRSHD